MNRNVKTWFAGLFALLATQQVSAAPLDVKGDYQQRTFELRNTVSRFGAA